MNSELQKVRLLAALLATHFLVDSVASVINPLWPTLQLQTASSDRQFLWIFLFWNVATSFSQIGFGLLGDRFPGGWLIWAGPAVAIISLSAIGMTSSLWALCLLVSAAGLGIASFHPEAASLAGNCLPHQRSRALSFFQLGGFLGQTAGPYYSGQIVDRWGVVGLMPGLIWMLALILVVRFVVRPGTHGEAVQHPAALRIADVFQGRWLRLAQILLIGVLRIIPASGVPMALAFLASARNSLTADIGLVQSAFTFGIGGGGLYCALFVQRRQERRLLWLLPLLAAPILLTIPGVQGAMLLASSAAAGLLLGITMPILVGLGQQMLPQSQRVASSITMGLSWGIGGAVAALLVMGFKHRGTVEQAFPLFALAAVLSSLVCLSLPRFHADSTESGR